MTEEGRAEALLRTTGQLPPPTFVSAAPVPARTTPDSYRAMAWADPGLEPVGWEVRPAAGANLEAYRGSIEDATNHAADVGVVPDSATDEGFLLFEGVISLLGLVLVVISLGRVFNTVLLETRQRIRETAILKAIG